MAPLLRLPVDLLLREGTDSLRLEVHRLENLLPLFYFVPIYLLIRVFEISHWLLSSEELFNSSELPAHIIIATNSDKSSMIRVIMTNCPDKFLSANCANFAKINNIILVISAPGAVAGFSQVNSAFVINVTGEK